MRCSTGICNAHPAPTPGPYRPCVCLTRTYEAHACSPRGSPYDAPLIGLSFKSAETAATVTWFASATSAASLSAPASQDVRFLRANSFSEASSLPLPLGGLLPSRTACNPHVAVVAVQEQAETEFEAFVLVWSEERGYEFLSPGYRLVPDPVSPGRFMPGSRQRFCLTPSGSSGEPESRPMSRKAGDMNREQAPSWVIVFDVKRRDGGCCSESAQERRDLQRWFFGPHT